jgi:hypothetical protein
LRTDETRFRLLHDLARAHPPKCFLCSPSAVAVRSDAAPVRLALIDARDHPGLEIRIHRCLGVGALKQRGEIGFDDHGADPRQKGEMHPAANAVTILHPSPVAEFTDDFQRHVRWVSDGPRRTLPSFTLSETKRGIGRLVTGPRSPAKTVPFMTAVRLHARNHALRHMALSP